MAEGLNGKLLPALLGALFAVLGTSVWKANEIASEAGDRSSRIEQDERTREHATLLRQMEDLRSGEAAKIATAERLARLETTQGQNVENARALRDLLKSLDETLQREMRLLDDKTRAEGQEIDKRLQSELDLKLAPLREALERMGKDRWTLVDHDRFAREIERRFSEGGK